MDKMIGVFTDGTTEPTTELRPHENKERRMYKKTRTHGARKHWINRTAIRGGREVSENALRSLK